MAKNVSWFAVKVRFRFERSVSACLAAKNTETFAPTYWVSRRWSDRVKKMEVPLFPGYVFCRIHPEDRLPVLTIPGVQYVVGVGREPAPVADSEIESIRTLLASGMPAAPRAYLAEGEPVRIDDGPLRGVEGVLLTGGDSDELVVSIPLLRRSVAVTVGREWLLPLCRPGRRDNLLRTL